LKYIKDNIFLIYNIEKINFISVTKKEELIYDLIFSQNKEFNIDISKYIDDIYKYEDFISEIRKVLKMSKVITIDSKINIDSKTAIWKLKVNK
jgi:hypothetical protein